MFRADDNLESVHGCAALRQLYVLIYSGKVEGCSLQTFEAATGLRLTDQDGSLREDLPAITTFLNRLLALTIALQNTLFEVFEDLLRTRIEGAIASGTYDLGVETVTAESLTVTSRKTIYTHPQGGAETQVLTILRRERNKPLTLPKALDVADSESRSRLLVNRQSGRAAVQVPTTSLMLDDGAVERRVRLMRPMEHPAITIADLAKTQWREADRTEFTQAWEAELAALPEFTDSTLHIVTGLLLPIWKRLPHDSKRVYRLQTDAGERIIGRLVSPAWVAQASENEVPTLSPADAFAAVLEGRTLVQLADGLELRRVRVMGEVRIELSGFTEGMVERLKAMGLMSEIIAWKLRLFVPTGSSGPAILGTVMERYPLVRVADRARREPMSPAADLAHRLARDAEAVCRYYLPHGRREGRYWLVGDVADTPGRSLFVRLHGPDHGKGAAGRWQDAASGEYGDLLDLIALNRRLDRFRDVLAEARAFLSLPRPEPVSSPRPPVPCGSPEAARRLFAMARPLSGTLAEAYLRGRGITALPGTGACASTPAATTVRMMTHLSRPGRR